MNRTRAELDGQLDSVEYSAERAKQKITGVAEALNSGLAELANAVSELNSTLQDVKDSHETRMDDLESRIDRLSAKGKWVPHPTEEEETEPVEAYVKNQSALLVDQLPLQLTLSAYATAQPGGIRIVDERRNIYCIQPGQFASYFSFNGHYRAVSCTGNSEAYAMAWLRGYYSALSRAAKLANVSFEILSYQAYTSVVGEPPGSKRECGLTEIIP